MEIRNEKTYSSLEKFGFKKKYYYNGYVLCSENRDIRQDIFFDLKTRKMLFCNWAYDVLFDLIKADLVEVVENGN
jgi:hypothetical protein